MPRILTIDGTSPHLTAVKQLGRDYRHTLGFLPVGAFDDYAGDRHIIVALDDQETCVGYLLYRVVRDRVTIAHFCVSEQVRRQGFARALLNHLIQETKRHLGILLSCRVDFEANKTWPRLGFGPVRRKPGRAGELQIWWQSYGHADLFSGTTESDALLAAVDVNVFLDLVEQRDDESKELQADWLAPLVTLCHTDELSIELDRHSDPPKRPGHAAELERFKFLDCPADSFREAERALSPLFPDLSSERDQSDFRHLVRAAGAGADSFLTRDGRLLDKADEVFRVCGLAVVRPGELITHIDTLQQEHLYKQVQVAGTNQVFQARLTEAEQGVALATKSNEESAAEVCRQFACYLAAPLRYSCFKVTGRADEVLAAYVVDRHDGIDYVPYLRICDRRRAATLARTLLKDIVRGASASRAVLVTDPRVDMTACSDLGFIRTDKGQLKLMLTGWRTAEEADGLIEWDDPQVERLKAALPDARADAATAAMLEHMLWPLKISDAALPSFIVPIKVYFAEHLFDGRLSSGSLYGADVNLALNLESAYYRAARPSVITAPSRVLWYVSQDDDYEGTKCIRACSRIVEVLKDLPKPLYTRFRRLGVYEWKEVLATAGGLENKLMAFRFDDTELLPPMAWKDHQAILKDHNVNTTFQSPVKISPGAFGAIYTASVALCGTSTPPGKPT